MIGYLSKISNVKIQISKECQVTKYEEFFLWAFGFWILFEL